MADMDDHAPAGNPDDFETGIEVHPIGDLASAFMELIERSYGDDAEIGAVGMVAEVSFRVGAGKETVTMCWSNIDQAWVQAALFDEGARLTRGD